MIVLAMAEPRVEELQILTVPPSPSLAYVSTDALSGVYCHMLCIHARWGLKPNGTIGYLCNLRNDMKEIPVKDLPCHKADDCFSGRTEVTSNPVRSQNSIRYNSGGEPITPGGPED